MSLIFFFFFFFFFPQQELAKEKAGIQSAERLGKIYMRNNPFSNHPPTEFPLGSGACRSKRGGTVPGRRTELRGGKRHFQGELWPERTYGERKGTWGEDSRDCNPAANSAGPFPGCSHHCQRPGEAAGVHQARALPTVMPARKNINREILKHVHKMCVYAYTHI